MELCSYNTFSEEKRNTGKTRRSKVKPSRKNSSHGDNLLCLYIEVTAYVATRKSKTTDRAHECLLCTETTSI